MTEKELMSFAIARSNDPIIKNPVLRDALAMDLEPRIKAADGGLIDEALDAYNYYLKTRKSRPSKKRYKEIPFTKFFEIYGRENFADGQLVQPSVDGSRPGYMGKNVMSGSPAQQAENIRRQEESFKKISELFKNKDYTGLKLATRPARIKAGTQKDTGGKLNSNQQGQITEAIKGGPETQTAFAKKLGITRNEFIKGIEQSKSKITTELSENMKKMRFTPEVQLQQKMFYEILENPEATVQSMAKKFNVAEKEITKKSSQLLKNVYTQNVAITKTPKFDIDSRGKATLKSWLPDQYESTKNFLNNFSDIDGLKRVQSENMGILLANAYRNQPKKYTEAMKTLTAYNDFKNNLPKGMKADLDHPLSKEFIKGSPLSKSDPKKLLYVSPVDRGFNRGFKKQISTRYAKALLQGDKTAIKNIRALADRVGVNIGDVDGSKINYGTSKFDKNKNFALEYFNNLKEQNLVADNLKNLQKTKKGKQLIKDAKFKKGQIKPITKIKSKFLDRMMTFCPVGSKRIKKAVGGDAGPTCSLVEAKAGMKKQAELAAKASKDGKIPKKFGKLRSFMTNVFGLLDVPIELLLVLPEITAGNTDAAIQNSSLGWFTDKGKFDVEKLKDSNSETYQFLKDAQAREEFIEAENTLDSLVPFLDKAQAEGTLNQVNPEVLKQYKDAKNKRQSIIDEYEEYGYSVDNPTETPLTGKVATQKYLRNKVKTDWQKRQEKLRKQSNANYEASGLVFDKDPNEKILQYEDVYKAPTDLKSFIEQKGELGKDTMLQYGVRKEADRIGQSNIFDNYIQGADNKDVEDLYSELPIEYSSQLAALEKADLKKGLKSKGKFNTRSFQDFLKNQQINTDEFYAQGGLASLKRKI